MPLLFLRKIMQDLQRAGLVVSRRGPLGGYCLAVAPQDVSIMDIVEAMQGPLVMNECFDDPDTCERVEWCPVRKKLGKLGRMITRELAAATLGDVAASVRAKRASA